MGGRFRAASRRRRAALTVLLGVLAPLCTLAFPVTLGAQEPDRPLRTQDREPWGKIVHDIEILPASIKREQVLSRLKTKIGNPLKQGQIKEDMVNLFRILKFRVGSISYRLVGEDRVTLFYEIIPSNYFDKVEFKGMDHLALQEAEALTGLRENARISEDDAERALLLLRDRYRQDGYYFANIVKNVKTVQRDDYVERIVTFFVDEGPQVLVRSLRFRGNKSFPGDVPLGYGLNLQGDPKLDQVPGVFYGNPFSTWKVEDDIQKVELFYRRRGFLDCKVHLEERRFNAERDRVDLTYRVHEGERYKVTAVDVEVRRSADPNDPRPTRYTPEVLQAQIKLAAGDYYDANTINRDKRELEKFYGERGHPTARRYGRQFANLFEVGEPRLTYHPTRPEVEVTYGLVEGEPKRLREVRIHGNATTRDRVIRRHVKLFPGDILDVTKMDRSRYLLDRTRYFVDRTLSGVRFQLTPVPGIDEEVDLDIFVREGETGSFSWGAGVSSGTGVRANLQFNKRNFDITRLPSSWNPVVWFSEIAEGKAFHGGGQTLDLLASPGTEVSYFRVSWLEPDIFREHMDTIGLRVDAYKTIRILDSYDTDKIGAGVTLSRIFDETTTLSLNIRDETIEVKNIDSNAPLIVWNNEGDTEIRAMRLSMTLSDLDNPLHPRKGYNLETFAEYAGGLIGGQEDFYKLGAKGELYRPFYSDSFDRKHVIYSKLSMRWADTFGSTGDLFPSERFFMGGSNLRGFDQRRAGPVQFGEPMGGKALLLSTLEYQFPLVSTQMEGTTFHTEIIRGVLFTDFGLLGLDVSDSTFSEPRLTVGFGVRIQVPVLQVPIQLDLAWPILSQETDREEQLFFSFRHF